MAARLAEKVKTAITLTFDARTGDGSVVNGSAVAVGEYEEVVAVVCLGETNGTVDAHLEHSDASGSGFADITDAAIVQIAGTGDNAVALISVRPTKAYIRGVLLVENTKVADTGIFFLLFGARAEPVVNSPAAVIV